MNARQDLTVLLFTCSIILTSSYIRAAMLRCKAHHIILPLLLCCLLFVPTVKITAQNTIGIPTIINYPKESYNAGNQNWCMNQDSKGILYIANSAGLLSFDGTSWRLYPLPNRTIARSVLADSSGRIYIGGQGEIGYFEADALGELRYHSLNLLLPRQRNDFADVWSTARFNGHVFFRTTKMILEYDGKEIKIYESANWAFMGTCGNELLANDAERGLMTFNNGQWQPRIQTGKLPQNAVMRAAIPLDNGRILIATLMEGLFLLRNDSLSTFDTPDTRIAAGKNIFGATLLSDNHVALITTLGGCIVIDNSGHFVQQFTKKEGILNNNVLSVLVDRDHNLWLGLDNGINLVTYSNAIKNIYADGDDRNSGYSSVIHNGSLYLGLSTGVYATRLDPGLSDLSYSMGKFELIGNSKGQVWNLASVDNQLFLGHNKGAFIIRNEKAEPLDTRTGCWNFKPLYDSQPSSIVIAGTYSGINFYYYNNGTLTDPHLSIQFEAARFMVPDVHGGIWVAHPYKGVFYVKMDATGKPGYHRYNDRHHILSSNHNKIFRVGGKVVLTSDNGIFEWDEKQQDFVPDTELRHYLPEGTVSYLKDDQYGNTWFSRDHKLGVIDRSSGQPRIIMITELDGRILGGGFENVNIIDSNNVFVAAERGFFHINYAAYKQKQQLLRPLIRKVEAPLLKQSLVYGGYKMLTQEPRLSYRGNSLHFECSSSIFGQEQNTQYKYYLEGFDQDWSDWTRKTEKDYTNLPAGHYIFHVRCRNNFDNESPVTSFSFTILPPWYQTWWAYTIYALLIGGILYWFYKRQQRKYKRLQQIKLQEQQRKYAEEQRELQMLHELEIRESEKQIIELRNEKLQAEITHKNSELASSAMNLVRKKEMLSKLKEDLLAYKSLSGNDKGSREFQKILRAIDGELDHEEEWEQFAMHFDSVYANYLKKLKDYCPAITQSELKLAAYLRLNLSSKEIAQLMNISIRGVETSRYRLRKKLDVPNESNLTDFLASVTS